MWSWLDVFVSSSLIEQSLLTTIQVVGLIFGIFIGYGLLVNVKSVGKLGCVLSVFIGAVIIKVIITIFEWLKLYSWEIMKSSPVCIGPLAIVVGLFVYIVIEYINQKKKRLPKV